MTEEKYTAEQLEQMADQLLQENAPAQEKPAKGGLDEKTIASLPAAALLNGNEKLRDLFTKGKKKGKLDAGELSDVLDELDLESEQMDSIYDSLEQLGIEVGSEDFLADLPDEDGEPAMDEIAEIEEEELVDPNTLVDSFNIDDPVRMYLKEIGKVPLLTADQARTIRIPVHMVETINKVIRVSRQLLQELGHDPSPEEISAEMNMPVDKVREILKIAQEPVSLETPIGEEEDSHLGDFIPDEAASEPSEAASFTLLKEQLVDVLGTLTPREEKVLKLRFGIEDGRTRTLEEVGKEFNVTRERIRQIEAKALRKLRHPSRSKKLKDFLN